MEGATNDDICYLLSIDDWKGMELLFNTYYKRLVACADSYLKDTQAAEDVVQELFISIWEQRNKKILQSDTLSSYLFVATRNQCLHRLEKNDVLRHTGDLEEVELAFEEYNDRHDQIIKKIQAHINSLPPRSKDIMTAVFMDGLKYQEVADKYNISLSTVKTLIGNSIRRLRDILDPKDFIIFLIFAKIQRKLKFY